MRMDSTTLQHLVDSGIVEVRDLNGNLATVDRAMNAPLCFQVHAMSGLVFHVMYNNRADKFKLTEVPQ